MDLPLVLVDRSHPSCTILTLNRPNKRNALTIQLMEELCQAIEESQNLKNQRAIILKGAGLVFCAGLDLAQAKDSSLEDKLGKSVGTLLKTIYECPIVTIAAVHGAALAGGAGVVCACDLVIGESGTLLGLPEIRRGLVAAQIMPFLMRLLPRRILYELIFLGESIDAQRAYEIHLFNKVTSKGESLSEALKFVEALSLGGPEATKSAKRLMQQLDLVDFKRGVELGFDLHQEMFKSQEAEEGTRAFLEKRSPNWSKIKPL